MLPSHWSHLGAFKSCQCQEPPPRPIKSVSLGMEPGHLYILKLPGDFSLQAGSKITDVVRKPSFYRRENGSSEGLADA